MRRQKVAAYFAKKTGIDEAQSLLVADELIALVDASPLGAFLTAVADSARKHPKE